MVVVKDEDREQELEGRKKDGCDEAAAAGWKRWNWQRTGPLDSSWSGLHFTVTRMRGGDQEADSRHKKASRAHQHLLVTVVIFSADGGYWGLRGLLGPGGFLGKGLTSGAQSLMVKDFPYSGSDQPRDIWICKAKGSETAGIRGCPASCSTSCASVRLFLTPISYGGPGG